MDFFWLIALSTISKLCLTDFADNRISQWQRLRKIRKLIWKKWSRDYLINVHQRTKYLIKNKNLEIVSMFLWKIVI